MSINSYIAKQFSLPTGVGGNVVSFVMNRKNRPLYEETVRLLTLSSADSVLDLGCGNGYVLNMLARRYDCMFTGIDISESVIKAASRRNHKFVKSGRMELVCQDISKMSFPDHSFSKAYTINTVYFWEDTTRILAEIRRTLKPGGLFINTLYSNDTLSRFSHTQFGYKRFAIEQLASESEGAGFAVDVAPVLNGAAYCILCRNAE